MSAGEKIVGVLGGAFLRAGRSGRHFTMIAITDFLTLRPVGILPAYSHAAWSVMAGSVYSFRAVTTGKRPASRAWLRRLPLGALAECGTRALAAAVHVAFTTGEKTLVRKLHVADARWYVETLGDSSMIDGLGAT
jgi:hypothetical protein